MITRPASTGHAQYMGERHAAIGSVYDVPTTSQVDLESLALVLAGFLAGLVIGLWADG